MVAIYGRIIVKISVYGMHVWSYWTWVVRGTINLDLDFNIGSLSFNYLA